MRLGSILFLCIPCMFRIKIQPEVSNYSNYSNYSNSSIVTPTHIRIIQPLNQYPLPTKSQLKYLELRFKESFLYNQQIMIKNYINAFVIDTYAFHDHYFQQKFTYKLTKKFEPILSSLSSKRTRVKKLLKKLHSNTNLYYYSPSKYLKISNTITENGHYYTPTHTTHLFNSLNTLCSSISNHIQT